MQAALKPHLEFEFCPASEAYTPPPGGARATGLTPFPPSALPPPHSPSRVFRPPGPAAAQSMARRLQNLGIERAHCYVQVRTPGKTRYVKVRGADRYVRAERVVAVHSRNAAAV